MTIVSEAQAMARALVLARRGPTGENPRVGCVVLDRDGAIAGEGWHEGAGTAHAESVALAAAGDRARDGTAVVTLEPCAHDGRTGPCVQTLIDAAVGRVVYGLAEPNPVASGGAALLRSVGIDVAEIDDPTLRTAAVDLVRHWAFAVRSGRPFVTWKFATTLDGRSAARDGSSRWITGPAARADVHRLRAECDTVLVGTGTVLADDPQLTVREAAGPPPVRQPVRAVMGLRDLPPHARVLDDPSPGVLLRTRDPAEAVRVLWDRGARHILLEGGPTIAASFVAAGLVDEVIAYVAPAVLGAGPPAVADLGIDSIADAVRFELLDATVIGDDIRLTMRRRPPLG
jgi:diaminohydroxyphosphoribosylaminopyrimidine deaminase/5-amino-6-(5-phosphoribosylamino)uracil reductase